MSTLRSTKIFGREIKVELRSEADQSVFEEIFIDHEYKLLDPIIKNAQNPIIDIGAHIGCFSIYARVLADAPRIMAYEPDLDNFKLLQKNLQLNRIRHVTGSNQAVSSQIGSIPLYLSEDSHNHSIVIKSDSSIPTPTTTLDKICSKFPKISLIKIDCEGAEFQIIESTGSESFSKIENIYIEYHLEAGESLDRLIQILKKNNFRITRKPSHYDPSLGFILASKSAIISA